MPRRHVLALDQGTTSSRAIVFNARSKPLGSAQQEFAQSFPQPGWVEHDPAVLWESTRRVAVAALGESNLTAGDLAAIGLTNQRETTLIWERSTGRPIAPAIVWQDRRTAGLCVRLKRQGAEEIVRQKTGLVLDPYFSATKIAWLLDHVPGARRRAARGELAFGTVDAWLLWQLTGGGVHATDLTNAARTSLLNITTGAWDEDLLRLFRVPRELLPVVRSNSEVYGEVTTVPALRGVPIAGIAGDQHAALFGQACFKPGMAKNTYGTGCFLLLHTGTDRVTSRNNLLTTPAWRLGPAAPIEYALEGSVFIGGAVVQWLRDGLGLIERSADVEQLAAQVPDNGGVYLVPAFAGLGAPHWDADARGLMIGITRGTTAGHVARAALESIAFQSAELIAAMRKDAGLRLRELRVDGGATANGPLLQFQSDVLQVPVVRPRVTETTALGAAYLAGLATGVWKSQAEIAAQWRPEATFKPRASRASVTRLQIQWSRAVERAKGWVE